MRRSRRQLKRAPEGHRTFAELLRAVRLEAGETLDEFAVRLGVTRGNLCDFEHGRRFASYARVAEWAEKLGYEPAGFLEVVTQAELDAVGLGHLRVRMDAA